jgi:hypothetical protein
VPEGDFAGGLVLVALVETALGRVVVVFFGVAAFTIAAGASSLTVLALGLPFVAAGVA